MRHGLHIEIYDFQVGFRYARFCIYMCQLFPSMKSLSKKHDKKYYFAQNLWNQGISHITGEFCTPASTVFDPRTLLSPFPDLPFNISQALFFHGTHVGKSDIKVNAMEAVTVCFPEEKRMILAKVFPLSSPRIPYLLKKGAVKTAKA